MRSLVLLPVAVFAVACSSPSENPGAAQGSVKDAGGRDSSTTPPGDTGAGLQPEAAPPPDSGVTASCPNTGDPRSVCITEIHGRAIDENGTPIEKGKLVSACGTLQCNPGFTDDSGRFTISVGLRIVPDDFSVQVHRRVDFTAFYFALPASAKGPIIDVGDVRSFQMPATGPELAVDRAGVPPQSVTSGDVTLDVPDGIYVRLDIESNLADSEIPGKGRAFRALKIPKANLGEFVAPSLGVAALYAFEPFECTFEAGGVPDVPVKVRLSFANSESIPAGTAIDLLALGTYIYPTWIPPAEFTRVAQGHVSADGSRIELDPGEGLPYLTWVAVKPTP